MLLRQVTLEGIRAGTITLAFRRWRRPAVKSGGTLLTAIGQIRIGAVEPIAIETITGRHARQAGFASLDALLAELGTRSGQLYRIELGAVSADPRHALRAKAPSHDETRAIVETLARMDGRASRPWTAATLDLIHRHPGVLAATLAARLGLERPAFKANVRKLKALGLTISLEVGYELAPRGQAILRALGGPGGGPHRRRPVSSSTTDSR